MVVVVELEEPDPLDEDEEVELDELDELDSDLPALESDVLALEPLDESAVPDVLDDFESERESVR